MGMNEMLLPPTDSDSFTHAAVHIIKRVTPVPPNLPYDKRLQIQCVTVCIPCLA